MAQAVALTSSPELHMCYVLLIIEESKMETSHVVKVDAFESTAPPQVFYLNEFKAAECEAMFGDVKCVFHRHVNSFLPGARLCTLNWD